MTVKPKACDICDRLADLRYRIQYQPSADWVMVCRQCWDKVSQDNPHYRYGGTWKAKKK